MTELEALADRDVRLATATTPQERAEILGLDWPRLKTAGLTAFFALIGLVVLSGIVAAPIGGLFEAFDRAVPIDADSDLSLVQPLLAFAPFTLAFLVTQVILRHGRRWSPPRQQTIAISAREIVGTLGLGVVAVVLMNEPGGVTAVLLAGSLQGWLTLGSAITVPLGLWRGSKTLGFVVDQNRTLPAGATIVNEGVAPIFGWALVHTVTGVLIAALVWLHPFFALLVGAVFAVTSLGISRLRWTGRNGLALGVAWAFTGVLGALVILTF